MPDLQPPLDDILETIRQLLAAKVLPELDGRLAFEVRIALRLLDTAVRELRLGPAADCEELARLRTLVGRDGTRGDLNRELAAAIETGDIAFDDPALLRHLKRYLEDALAINNPKWPRDGSGHR